MVFCNHRAYYSFGYLCMEEPQIEKEISLGGKCDIRNTKFNDENPPNNANQALCFASMQDLNI